MKLKYMTIALLIATLSGCATQKVLTEQEMFESNPALAQAKKSIELAAQGNLALYAPVQLKSAENSYKEALRQAQNNDPKADNSANQVIANVEAAERQAVKAKYIFEEVFNARERAIKVKASSATPEAFENAETELASILALLEIGDDEKAKRDINALRNKYLDIELKLFRHRAKVVKA